MTAPDDPPTFDYFANWWRSEQRSEEVLQQYLREVRHVVAAGYERPPDLTLDDAKRYIAERTVKPNERTGQPISVERVKIVIRALKAYSAFCAAHFDEADKLAPITHPRSPDPVGGKIAQRAEVEVLLRHLAGRSGFAARRDVAMVMAMWVTGMRRSDLMRLRLDDIVERNSVAVIRRSKNGQGRLVSLRTKRDDAVVHLDRYLRLREAHAYAHLPDLWLGERGALTPDGFFGSLERRCAEAGIQLRSHEFRRSLASRWLSSGGSQVLLMETAGWSSNTTVQRYVRQDMSRLALDAARSLNA